MSKTIHWALAIAVLQGLTFGAGEADAARISDVRGTKHNLSSATSYTFVDPATGQSSNAAVPARTVRATNPTDTQVCVFCHTPHGGTSGITPQWNRAVSSATYTPYTSSTLDAQVITNQLNQPNGTSKLCLSCHDGTLAISSVNVLDGTTAPARIAMTGLGANDSIPDGSGAASGFTRRIGTDLTNDHPISFDFTDAVSARDGELRRLSANQRFPADGSVIGVRAAGFKPRLPLEGTGNGGVGQLQCATCHDPHSRETDTALGNQKFLRQSRFQVADPTTLSLSAYTPDQDIICVGCHDKNLIGGVWAFSAHANAAVANETYKTAAATQREFPDGLPVWRAACLNCHDTHTVQGSRRLLREGTDAVGVPKQGGRPAIEETCYQCHSALADTSNVLTALGSAPDIKTDFTTRAIRMPITVDAQGTGTETHDIAGVITTDPGFISCATVADARCGADFLESRNRLGLSSLANRHAECTDCHNPHRVLKGQLGAPGVLTTANTNQKAGTHRHEDAAAYTHSNIVSGVLRGSFGVEPVYGSESFHSMPSTFLVKRGDPGNDPCLDDPTCSAGAKPYVTREYQICLKCHSNYAYADDNGYPNSTTRPQLGGAGRTAANANGHVNFTSYTNQAKEFQAPISQQGGVGNRGLLAGAAAAFDANNHRSWHPVMNATQRSAAVRGGTAGAFALPWSNAVGTQTMYCSDCHGSSTGAAVSVMPTGNTNASEDGAPWGPHGSSVNFLLKGTWDTTSGGNGGSDLCLKCHNANNYANRGGGTGFNTDKGDGHDIHFQKIGRMRCNWCHVAVPHGWKNMALLVNLNDVGPEAALAAGIQVRTNTTALYSNGPYYRNAANKVRNFRSSGQWTDTDCGSAGAPGNNQNGRAWMRDSNENCANPP